MKVQSSGWKEKPLLVCDSKGPTIGHHRASNLAWASGSQGEKTHNQLHDTNYQKGSTPVSVGGEQILS